MKRAFLWIAAASQIVFLCVLIWALFDIHERIAYVLVAQAPAIFFVLAGKVLVSWKKFRAQ